MSKKFKSVPNPKWDPAYIIAPRPFDSINKAVVDALFENYEEPVPFYADRDEEFSLEKAKESGPILDSEVFEEIKERMMNNYGAPTPDVYPRETEPAPIVEKECYICGDFVLVEATCKAPVCDTCMKHYI